jgi:hypothetical protein
MSNYVKIQVSKTFEDKIKELDEQIEEDKRQVVRDRAVTALKYSFPFVDTGAYMTSWSISVGRGRPRGKSSRGRPKMDASAAFQESLTNIDTDIAKLDMSKEEFTLRNGAPHEPYVELKHRVFARLKGGS